MKAQKTLYTITRGGRHTQTTKIIEERFHKKYKVLHYDEFMVIHPASMFYLVNSD